MRDLLAHLQEQLEQIESEGLLRRLVVPGGIDFSSNDYLGLARDPLFRASVAERIAGSSTPLFAPASRLLRGHLPEHRVLEERLARFKGTEAALLFPTGYQANIGILTALIAPGDRVLSDAQNHASIIDGLRLSRCTKLIFPHLDVDFVEDALSKPHREGKTFLVTESLFSMDGDIAPLERYAELADRHGAALIVDDAHATGVFGDGRGSGLTELSRVEKRCLAIVSTLGKALGLWGAFVSAPRTVIDFLINRCRPFIFTTAVPPLLIHAVHAALDQIDSRPERRRRVLALARQLRGRLRERGLDTLQSEGPIVPVLLGENRRAVEVAAALQNRGLDVRAVRPPTVAPGTARLRISVHADHREEAVELLAGTLLEALETNRIDSGKTQA